MEIKQVTLAAPFLATAELEPLVSIAPHLVLVFAPTEAFTDPAFVAHLKQTFPNSHRVGCSDAGQISNAGVTVGRASITAVHFDRPNLRVACATAPDMASSRNAGVALGRELSRGDLTAVLLLGPGFDLNGSALIEGLAEAVGPEVILTGGLAGDDGRFEETWTYCGDTASPRNVVGVGFYGDSVTVSHGSFGGWAPFGTARKVTRCDGNILYELDGVPALEVYRRYLGEYAAGLPGTGLLFPFSMLSDEHDDLGLIRTILGIDESTGALILAGAVVQDGYLRLMHASTNALVDGAEMAAKAAMSLNNAPGDGLAIMVSCVGRRLMMGGRVEEEFEAVAAVFGEEATLAGFYSNGEFAPILGTCTGVLHNQTMTIAYLHD
ncbi:MAG: FIST N-terminal domain-containing protein [Gemmatimonadota bacterium]